MTEIKMGLLKELLTAEEILAMDRRELLLEVARLQLKYAEQRARRLRQIEPKAEFLEARRIEKGLIEAVKAKSLTELSDDGVVELLAVACETYTVALDAGGMLGTERATRWQKVLSKWRQP